MSGFEKDQLLKRNYPTEIFEKEYGDAYTWYLGLEMLPMSAEIKK